MKKQALALHGGPKVRRKPFPVHPVMGAEERSGVLGVLKTGKLSGFIAKAGDAFLGGPKVRELEKLFEKKFGARYAMAVNSATAGLHCALAACGVGPGDEVIVPPYTMAASASAVLMCSAVPRFVDISEDIFSLDPELLEKAITPRTKAIVVVHLFGHPARMDEILQIARRHKLKVVEDCAQSPGAKYKGKYAGTLGDAGVYSFNQHKTITTGEGGVVVTNDDTIALKVRLVRNHGEAVVEDMQVEDISNTLGWNYRMTELEAAVGCAQFRKLDRLTAHRVKLVNALIKGLRKFPGLTMPATLQGATHTYFVVPIRYDAAIAGIPRDLLIKALAAEGIPFGQGYVKPIYLMPHYRQLLCHGSHGWPFAAIPASERQQYKKGLCPVTEKLHEETLIHTNLCYYPMTLADAADIVAAFEKIFANTESLLSGAPAAPAKPKRAKVGV
ncbi:MAG TPA: DegT/DnrJ/EryC1/StrS family aminotransferase [Verrucomicrobiae bacterium]|nr:DegT/DnrJ/EryC1/StrS family aminotransferase [Verrucomicrobiae bacterium]